MLYINFQLLMYHTVLNESQNCEILVIMIDIIIWSDVRIISEKNTINSLLVLTNF